MEIVNKETQLKKVMIVKIIRHIHFFGLSIETSYRFFPSPANCLCCPAVLTMNRLGGRGIQGQVI
jgi:hypothetical protein